MKCIFMSTFCASDSSQPSPPFLCASSKRGLRGGTFSASADRAAGILVETGNSVDYSLAIRLLSLRWLSLLHHEIAWLSARLESVLCSNLPPPAHYLPLHPPTTQPYHPSPSSPHLGKGGKKKEVHLAPLRSARQCNSKTG